MTDVRTKKQYGTIAGVLGLVCVVILKFKGVIFAAFKGLPLLKLGWLLKGSSSMFLSLGLYTAMYGWRYAITLIVLIYIHEMGHYIFMKVKGLNPKAPVFVPFLGAYVAMTNLPKDMATHAWTAYAGPFIGGLGAALFYLWGQHTGNLYFVAAANTGFMLNLLQLIPVRPFDGGFIAAAITRWLSIPGIVALVMVALCFHSVLLLIICAFSLFGVVSAWRGKANVSPEMVPASAADRVVISIAYFGLAGILAWCFWGSTI